MISHAYFYRDEYLISALLDRIRSLGEAPLYWQNDEVSWSSNLEETVWFNTYVMYTILTHWKDILLVIGGVGTLWGIAFPVYLLHSQKKDSRPNVRATISAGANVYGNELSEAMLYLQALNEGSKAINIVSVGVLLPNKIILALMDPSVGSGLPYLLKPEGNARYWYAMRSIARELHANGFSGTVPVRGVIRDAVGRKYVTKKYEIKTIEGWLR